MTSRLRVLVLAQSALDIVPGQRFRFEQYIEPLAEHGIELELRSILDRSTTNLLYESGNVPAKARLAARAILQRIGDTLAARRYDLAFVYRWIFPLGPPIFEMALSVLRVPYLLDFDDAIYIPHTSEANRFVKPLKYSRKTRGAVAHAALVTTGNEHLATWSRRFNCNVRVIPTTIDTEAYVPFNRRTTGPLTIGWTGSRTTIPHLSTIADVLARIQHEEGVRLRVIGDHTFSIPGARVDASDWSHDSELSDLSEFDIGIMPLPDDEWSRGKCGGKALQCMALGIPTVMSPVGVNVDIARGGAAVLASTPEEWLEALRDLIRDRAERKRLAIAGRRRVVETYSIHANVSRWADALNHASGRA